MKLFRADARCSPDGLGGRCRHRRRRRRHDRRGRRRTRDARRARGARGSGRPGDAESAFACVPARARRAHGAAVARPRRQLLDVARRRCTRFLDRIDADAFEAIAAQATSRWPRPATRRSRSSTTSITIPRASPTPIPRSSRCASSRGREAAGIGLTLLPVFYAHAGLRRHAADGRAAPLRAHDVRRSRSSSSACASGPPQHGYVLGVAPHSLRAVTPEELGHIVRLAGAGRADPHPRGRADARGRRVLRVEPHASGRVAADAGGRRSALVRRARDAHDRARGRRRSRRAARSPDSRRRPRPISATARFPGRATLQRADASASAAIRTRSSRRSPSCASSSGRSALRARRAQRARDRRRRCRSARRCGQRARAAARRRWRSRSARSRAGMRADLVVLDADDPALAEQTSRRRARCGDLRSGAPCRCAT